MAGATATVAVTFPSEVPAAIGVAVVEVQVSVSSVTVVVPSTQVHPDGVGAAENVSPAGRVVVSVGWLDAEPPPAPMAGVTVSP